MASVFRLLSRSKQLHFSRLSLHGIRARSLENAVPVTPCFKDFSSPAPNKTLVGSHEVLFRNLQEGAKHIGFGRKFHASRCSTLPEEPNDLRTQECVYTFIKSTFNTLEGLNYRWLNKNKWYKQDFDEDGVFIVVVGAFHESPPFVCDCDQISMIEKVKLLQQRYPKLQVFGFEHCNSMSSVSTENHLVKAIVEHYVTFPVLLTEKEFFEVTKQPRYLLFEGFEGPFLHFDWNVDTKVIAREIEEFNLIPSCNSVSVKELNSYGIRQADVTKGFYACPSFRNLILHHPGCISVDEFGKRLFISDSNHHRIIVTDGDGKIFDCIGCSPGFEDGGFESAELLRPAGSVYNADEDCLYFADSENHAIRRADMMKRVVETIYPVYGRNVGGIWNWIIDKIGMKREIPQDKEELDQNSFTFPWHLIMLGENDLLVFSRSLEASWILSMETGQIKSNIRGFPNVMEAYSEMISTKVSPLKELLGNWLPQRVNAGGLLDGFPFAELISTTAELNNTIIFCDTAGQTVLKYNQASGNVTNVQFSDLQMLGMPYWLACPTEKVIPSVDAYGLEDDYLQHFSLLPGRCDIWVNIDIPKGTKLVAPVSEECIRRRARGSAAEITDLEIVESADKVGVAQQWYDELDNLAFSNPSEVSSAKQEDIRQDTIHINESMVRIKCAVNTSPGTSEVIVSAVLYMKPGKESDMSDSSDVTVNPSSLLNLFKVPGDDASVNLLLESGRDIRDVIFMKPLHVRIRLECADHPLRPKSREIISTDSNLEVNISL